MRLDETSSVQMNGMKLNDELVPYGTVYEPTPEELEESRLLSEQFNREFTHEMLMKISSKQKRDPKYLFSD